MRKFSATDLSTLQALIEQERGEDVVEIVEKHKAYVFKFAKSRPFVVPKEID